MISPAYQGSFLFGLQLGQFVLICIRNSKTQQKAGKTPSVSDQRQSWAECLLQSLQGWVWLQTVFP